MLVIIKKEKQVEDIEANYIINYFPRLMTEIERKAKRHFFFSMKLGKPEDYDDIGFFDKQKEFFEKRNGIAPDKKVLKLLENGYSEFVLETAQRIKNETPKEYRINRCPNCSFIAKTPYVKQCRKCGENWHSEIAGEFQFDTSFRITGRPFLWIVGELVKGHFQTGFRVDLTNFQLNIITEIKQIEFCLKSVNGIRKDYPSLGIEVNEKEQELIKKYLTKSAKTIMILKEKEYGD